MPQAALVWFQGAGVGDPGEEVKRSEGTDAATLLLLYLQGNFSYGALQLSIPTNPEWVGWGPAEALCLCLPWEKCLPTWILPQGQLSPPPVQQICQGGSVISGSLSLQMLSCPSPDSPNRLPRKSGPLASTS